MNDPKDCPFCGRHASRMGVRVKEWTQSGNCYRVNVVGCVHCRINGDEDVWNTRDNTELEHCCRLIIDAGGISTGHADNFTDLIEECILNVVESKETNRMLCRDLDEAQRTIEELRGISA